MMPTKHSCILRSIHLSPANKTTEMVVKGGVPEARDKCAVNSRNLMNYKEPSS